MGFLKVPTIYTLTFEGTDYDGLIVRMKGLSVGRIRRLMRATGEGETEDQAVGEILELLAEGLVSWNLEDENGPVPPTAAGLEDQDFAFILTLSNDWLDQVTGVDEKLGKDSGSGETFPGRPLTMEAL